LDSKLLVSDKGLMRLLERLRSAASLLPDLCAAACIRPKLELKPNHLGTPLSLGETDYAE
jgi:hypothetical protein